jgi:hypothetical protein
VNKPNINPVFEPQKSLSPTQQQHFGSPKKGPVQAVLYELQLFSVTGAGRLQLLNMTT